MTYEEIIAQAKTGGTATVRAQILSVDVTDRERPLKLGTAEASGVGLPFWPARALITDISPPEWTLEGLLAENEALKAEIARLTS